MSYFTAKMHQIRFRLRLCPRPLSGGYSAPPDLAEFNGPTSKGKEGRGRNGVMWRGNGEGRGSSPLLQHQPGFGLNRELCAQARM